MLQTQQRNANLHRNRTMGDNKPLVAAVLPPDGGGNEDTPPAPPSKGGEKTLHARLAPSPTGAQHVGNARTYLIAWLSARGRGGRVVLRVEDIDSPRVKAGAAGQAC